MLTDTEIEKILSYLGDEFGPDNVKNAVAFEGSDITSLIVNFPVPGIGQYFVFYQAKGQKEIKTMKISGISCTDEYVTGYGDMLKIPRYYPDYEYDETLQTIDEILPVMQENVRLLKRYYWLQSTVISSFKGIKEMLKFRTMSEADDET